MNKIVIEKLVIGIIVIAAIFHLLSHKLINFKHYDEKKENKM